MKIIIQGVTESGVKFRPSDWAQRLATAVSTMDSRGRIVYHPKVSATMYDGISCVVIDVSLEEEEPLLYSFLTEFGKNNSLKMEKG